MGDKEREGRSERRHTETHELQTYQNERNSFVSYLSMVLGSSEVQISLALPLSHDSDLSLSLTLSLGADLSRTIPHGADLSLTHTISHGADRVRCGTPHLARPMTLAWSRNE